MNLNNYIITAPTTPTYFPDELHQISDVLDIAIIENLTLPYAITNLDDLLSDYYYVGNRY